MGENQRIENCMNKINAYSFYARAIGGADEEARLNNANRLEQLVNSYIESGDVDDTGKVWTMHSELTNPQTGQLMKKRSVIKLVDQDHNSVEMYYVGPDGNEMKAMEIQYVRH